MIGRIVEQKELLRALESQQSEFVALYGRRRVGKTFLVNEFFNGRFARVKSCEQFALSL